MVDEFYRENLDLVDLFEGLHIYMLSLRNVEEDTIDKEEECFHVEELAPREAEVKEELSQAFVVNSTCIEAVLPILLLLLASDAAHLHP